MEAEVIYCEKTHYFHFGDIFCYIDISILEFCGAKRRESFIN